MKTTILIILLCFSSLVANSQSGFAKKDTVIPKFSFSLVKFEDFKAWQGRMQYYVSVAKDGDTLVVGQDRNWSDRGLPDLVEYTVREININKGKPTEVYIVSNISLPAEGTKYESYKFPRQVKFIIAADVPLQTTLEALLFKGSSEAFLKSDYIAGVQERIRPTIFTGPLASIPPSAQKKLMTWSELRTSVFGSEALKEKHYLSVNTSQDVAYNTIQVNKAERTARQAEFSIKKLKEIFGITGRPEGLEGIVLTASIVSYDFVRKDDRATEKFQMFVPFELLSRFSNLDITDQDLVDGSTILLDGSRVKVNLSSF